MGGLLSVVLYLTCFQRKQYLLIVCLNSFYVLWNTSMFMFAYLDYQYGNGKSSVFIALINSDSVYKTFFWGLIESACNFILIYILPMLLAIKFRSAHEIAMGGTIIGVVTAANYVVSSFAFCLIGVLYPVPE